jgi:hypothetical protein
VSKLQDGGLNCGGKGQPTAAARTAAERGLWCVRLKRMEKASADPSRSSQFVCISCQTQHPLTSCLFRSFYLFSWYTNATPCFFDKCTAAFAVNNHLPQSGKASCRPWSSQNDHPGHISSLFHTHTSNMIFPHQCISTCICVNSSCQSTYTFKLPTPR